MIEQEELTYLQKTTASLQAALKQLSKELNVQDGRYKDLQKYLVEYKAELDKFEVYDYQQSLHMIDKQGFAKAMEREQVLKLIDSPYFGRFDFVYEGDDVDDAEHFYIGRFGHADVDGTTLVYDWRAPICNMYYEFEIGEAFYEAMNRTFNGQLTRKKQIKIEKGEIQFALESSLTIQDEVLQQTLHQQGSEKMKTIISSIQQEQNKIVRNERAYNVVIQGVAGSGKTAVALHRLAYYLYKFRDTLRAERIFILSPNKVFGDYISSVLPELGEQPIRSFTLDELTQNLLPTAVSFTSFEEETRFILSEPNGKLANRAKLKANYMFVEKLNRYLSELDGTLLKHAGMSIADTPFSADYLQVRFTAYKKEPMEVSYQSEEEMLTALHAALESNWKTTAIICKSSEDVEKLKVALKVPFTILDGETEKFETGVLLTTIQYAKGLEFDRVIVPFVDQTHYDTAFDKGLLYIATTRAMHELTMLVDAKQPSPLL